MFTITYEHVLFALICFFSLLGGIFIKRIVNNVQEMRSRNKLVKEGYKKVKELKDSGNHHEWVNIPIGTEIKHVCKKTGYCPSLEGFIPVYLITMHLERVKMEEEFELYKASKMDDISNEHSISKDDLDKIADKIFGIKQSFHVQLMDRNIKQMREGLKNENNT